MHDLPFILVVYLAATAANIVGLIVLLRTANKTEDDKHTSKKDSRQQNDG